MPPVDSMISLGGRRRGPGFAQRLASTRDLVGYTDDDEALVHATRDVVLARSDAIVGGLYEHLLSHRETAAHFKRANGSIDGEALKARHETLRGWLTIAIEAPLDAKLAIYLADIGRAHTGRGAKDQVPARFLVVAMSFLHTEVIDILGDAVEDWDRLLATISAWSKLLMVHLDLFLAVYASGAGTAHWY